MRVLVPLSTAAALAIGGWLASGTLTVRSLHAPDRIGLLPPPGTVITILLPLLALSSLSGALSWRRAAAVVALLVPVVLPWFPVSLPPALLAWTGPLGHAWWLACVAYAYADAWARVAARFADLLRSPVRAPLVAAVVTGVTLLVAAWHMAPQHPKGDEPDYLIVTQSLLLDRDLRIENNHARADYAAYHRDVLPPSYLQRGANGAIYSVHAPGLPVLLVPGFALAGHQGAIAALVAVAMCGAWLAWRTCWDLTGDASASWVGTLATVGAAPFFLHGAAIFPDAPASVLALVAVAALARGTRRREDSAIVGGELPVRYWVGVACALASLPWLHTRYALIAGVLGSAVALRLWVARAWHPLVAFLAIGLAAAASWLGFFWVVYGAPDPSAPYGAYTQMAIAHLAPGLPGLLVDQQFGLIASAPVLALAVVALRPSIARTAPQSWWLSLAVLLLAGAYTVAVAAYRMWWGGFSAPARFLVPIILPLAPLVALAWTSLRSCASRYFAFALLAASLMLTVTLVVVDRGALAYNVRDGRALWVAWASPLVDLAAALPAAHRDAPLLVVRDACVWFGAFAVAWFAWRGLERRGRLHAFVPMLTIAAVVPAAAAVLWTVRGVSGWAPLASQLRYLTERADEEASALIAVTPPPVGRTRTWFDVQLESSHAGGRRDYALLRVAQLPAGTYRLRTDITAPGARLGVTIGEERATRFLAELDGPATERVRFTLPLPAERLIVKGSPDAARADGRVWLEAEDVRPSRSTGWATRTATFGDTLWLLPGHDVFPEPDGAWIAGDADVTIGVLPDAPLRLQLRAGAAAVRVILRGSRGETVDLAAGATRDIEIAPHEGRLRVQTRGGFRPSQSSPDSDDQRWLGVWLSPR